MPGAHTWLCPRCERRVPLRAPECHCGFERRQLRAVQRATVPGSPSQERRPGRDRGVLYAGSVVLVVLYAVAWLALGGGPQIAARPSEGVEGTLRRDVARDPSLPPIETPDVSQSSAAQTVEELLRQHEQGSVVEDMSGRASRTDELEDFGAASEEWPGDPLSAEAQLAQTAAAARTLEAEARAFSQTCQASLAIRDIASPCGWLVDLKKGPDPPGRPGSSSDEARSRGDLPNEEPVTVQESAPDGGRDERSYAECAAAWRGLIEQAKGISAALGETGALAESEGLSGERWRQLVAAAGLSCFL